MSAAPRLVLVRFMRSHSRIVTYLAAILAVAIAGHAGIAKCEDQPKHGKTPRTEYIRYEPGADPARASRQFDGKWKATFISTPWPDYPYEARRSRITGRGLLRIYVDESGRVSDVRVLKSTGNRQLDDAGLAAFRHWRAKAGPRREVDMPLTFTLSGGQSHSDDNGFRKDGVGIMPHRAR